MFLNTVKCLFVRLFKNIFQMYLIDFFYLLHLIMTNFYVHYKSEIQVTTIIIWYSKLYNNLFHIIFDK